MLPKTFHEIYPELFPAPPDDPYVYRGTLTLRNQFNIRESFNLKKIEKFYYENRLRESKQNPIKGNFDFDHLKAFHHHLFQDVYDWAGQPRTNEILDMKNYASYCPAKDIEKNAKEAFDNVKKENHLKGLEPNKFTEKVTDHYMMLERIHPFRDGNARTQAEFFRELALENGYQMDLNRVSKEDFNAAKEAAYTGGDFGKENIRNMFRDSLDVPSLERYRAKIHDMQEFKTYERDIWAAKQETQGMSTARLQAFLTDKAGALIKNDDHLSKCREIKINIQKIENTETLEWRKSRALAL